MSFSISPSATTAAVSSSSSAASNEKYIDAVSRAFKLCKSQCSGCKEFYPPVFPIISKLLIGSCVSEFGEPY